MCQHQARRACPAVNNESLWTMNSGGKRASGLLAFNRELGSDQVEAKTPGNALGSVIVKRRSVERRSPERPDGFGPCRHGLRSEPSPSVRRHRFDTCAVCQGRCFDAGANRNRAAIHHHRHHWQPGGNARLPLMEAAEQQFGIIFTDADCGMAGLRLRRKAVERTRPQRPQRRNRRQYPDIIGILARPLAWSPTRSPRKAVECIRDLIGKVRVTPADQFFSRSKKMQMRGMTREPAALIRCEHRFSQFAEQTLVNGRKGPFHAHGE